MSGSRLVITPPWLLSRSWRSFFYSSSVYSCHLFLISSASVRSIPFLSFIEHIFAWNVPLVSLIFLKRTLVFPVILSKYFPCNIWDILILKNICCSSEMLAEQSPIFRLAALEYMVWLGPLSSPSEWGRRRESCKADTPLPRDLHRHQAFFHSYRCFPGNHCPALLPSVCWASDVLFLPQGAHPQPRALRWVITENPSSLSKGRVLALHCPSLTVFLPLQDNHMGAISQHIGPAEHQPETKCPSSHLAETPVLRLTLLGLPLLVWKGERVLLPTPNQLPLGWSSP